jgi:hypothetical protein
MKSNPRRKLSYLISWRMRNYVDIGAWLLKGDNNIEFFHRVANGRKRK